MGMLLDAKKYLESKGISFKVFLHPPVYTVEEAKKYSQDIRGIHSKNLFLKGKKSKQFYLVIIPADNQANMDKLGAIAGDKLKFANEDDLKELLGLTSGAVSPFGLINDKERKVDLLIDKAIWESDYVSFHPNVNTESLELKKEDFHKYIKSIGNKYLII